MDINRPANVSFLISLEEFNFSRGRRPGQPCLLSSSGSAFIQLHAMWCRSSFTIAYYTKALHTAVNHAPSPQHQSKVTLVLLCLSGALGLMLLPEWGTFTWIRLGYNKPPVGLIIFAQVMVYACSSFSPVILMTMYDDVRQGLIQIWFIASCRGSKQLPSIKCQKTEGNGAEVGAKSVENAIAQPAQEGEKTIPDVEHFWTGRRNTHVEVEQDPVPWEREEKML
ncbi:hypothetical protein KUCAC02_025873 [Chaenocephalus aceratus]|uniref:Uncharacterized protein n=1 Tax=Chaenocephalus aceratus TaxID=36190 RepID=A0ACB9VVV4_CHAAC|nr:hypothetical protein KUCAC02_025873 [Chaenocephalus aceratus]